jgi:hypothetical protein
MAEKGLRLLDATVMGQQQEFDAETTGSILSLALLFARAGNGYEQFAHFRMISSYV